MKTYSFILLFTITYVGSVCSQETPKTPKLLKKPRVYNAIVKSDEELIPSQSYPAVAPVVRPLYTGLFPYAPIIIPQVQPYVPEEYGHLKATSDYEGGRTHPDVKYPSKQLTPPSLNQPKPTYRAPSTNLDQVPFDIEDEITQNNGSKSFDYDISSNQPQGSPQPLNYEGDLSPTAIDDSYFPQDISTKSQQSNDYAGFLQPPAENSNTKQSKANPENVPQDSSPFQGFFNYQPENSDIPNVPPPPLPVKQNENNSTKKKMDYPNAPPTLFSI